MRHCPAQDSSILLYVLWTDLGRPASARRLCWPFAARFRGASNIVETAPSAGAAKGPSSAADARWLAAKTSPGLSPSPEGGGGRIRRSPRQRRPASPSSRNSSPSSARSPLPSVRQPASRQSAVSPSTRRPQQPEPRRYLPAQPVLKIRCSLPTPAGKHGPSHLSWMPPPCAALTTHQDRPRRADPSSAPAGFPSETSSTGSLDGRAPGSVMKMEAWGTAAENKVW